MHCECAGELSWYHKYREIWQLTAFIHRQLNNRRQHQDKVLFVQCSGSMGLEDVV